MLLKNKKRIELSNFDITFIWKYLDRCYLVYFPISGEFPVDPRNLQACKCKLKCKEIHYSAKLSTVKFPSKMFTRDLNYTEGRKFLPQLDFMVSKETRRY